MNSPGYILLTGATGFLGRWLLRDLLAAGRRVAVLARDGAAPADERVRELIGGWAAELPRRHDLPTVIVGDLRAPKLGLSAVDRDWLRRNCGCVVHAAADISFRPEKSWAANVEGTARLLELGIAEFHHVSTAFVCGDRAGPIHEAELDAGQKFHNEYEHSKFEAECRVRATRSVRATVYRPSVIIGDSRSGVTTSYQGLYRFLLAAQRLAAADGRMALPFSGAERRSLVPVDWVAGAIVRLMDRPAHHGRTFHLVSPAPTLVSQIKAAADELLGTARLRLEAPGRSPVESSFLRLVSGYESYLRSDPGFDCRNTLAALPDFPAPAVDRPLLKRLIHFALADGWGRRQNPESLVDCADYIERFLPAAARRSVMRELPIDVSVGLDIAGAGRWRCIWTGGDLVAVRREPCAGADVVFRADAETFGAVVRNRLSPQEAFLTRRIDIEGDVERGLKLAVLFGELLREFPYNRFTRAEAADAVACAG
jgi:thioester reductase-like protein